jgi:hypothetical protein
MGGTFAPSAALLGLARGIDGVALVMAGTLLTVVFLQNQAKGAESLLAGQCPGRDSPALS